MKYRVAFKVYKGTYFTDWFKTHTEANIFVFDADRSPGVAPLWVENEDGEVMI